MIRYKYFQIQEDVLCDPQYKSWNLPFCMCASSWQLFYGITQRQTQMSRLLLSWWFGGNFISANAHAWRKHVPSVQSVRGGCPCLKLVLVLRPMVKSHRMSRYWRGSLWTSMRVLCGHPKSPHDRAAIASAHGAVLVFHWWVEPSRSLQYYLMSHFNIIVWPTKPTNSPFAVSWLHMQ